MKKSLLFVSLLCAPLVAAHAKPAKKVAAKPAGAKAAGIVWRTNFDAALKEARQTGRPVFVDFYTDWCGACKYLDQTTYHDAKFVRASRNWVMVRINAEKGARNVQITRKYQVSAYPTLLMLDRRGQKLNQVAGAYPTDMMLSEMQKAQKSMGVLSAQNATARTVG